MSVSMRRRPKPCPCSSGNRSMWRCAGYVSPKGSGAAPAAIRVLHRPLLTRPLLGGPGRARPALSELRPPGLREPVFERARVIGADDVPDNAAVVRLDDERQIRMPRHIRQHEHLSPQIVIGEDSGGVGPGIRGAHADVRERRGSSPARKGRMNGTRSVYERSVANRLPVAPAASAPASAAVMRSAIPRKMNPWKGSTASQYSRRQARPERTLPAADTPSRRRSPARRRDRARRDPPSSRPAAAAGCQARPLRRARSR
jgi:hypothetical protein